LAQPGQRDAPRLPAASSSWARPGWAASAPYVAPAASSSAAAGGDAARKRARPPSPPPPLALLARRPMPAVVDLLDDDDGGAAPAAVPAGGSASRAGAAKAAAPATAAAAAAAPGSGSVTRSASGGALLARLAALERQVEELKTREQCVVCLERPRGVLLMPCSHAVLCSICAAKLPTGKCPYCMTAIASRLPFKL